MTKIKLPFLAKLAILAAPTLALAGPAEEFRCSTDRPDQTAILQRVEWARRCALLRNSSGPLNWINSTRAFDRSFNWAKDYVEVNPNRAYSSNLNEYNVNYYHAFSLYSPTPIYTVTQETSGPTVGYFRWSHTVLRPRPLYPVFETSPVAGQGTQLFPLPTLPDDCNLYMKNPTTGVYTKWTGNFYVSAYCEQS